MVIDRYSFYFGEILQYLSIFINNYTNKMNTYQSPLVEDYNNKSINDGKQYISSEYKLSQVDSHKNELLLNKQAGTQEKEFKVRNGSNILILGFALFFVGIA